MYPIIVADIGGTNARFALVTGEKDGQFILDKIQVLNGSEFNTFSDVLRHYIGALGDVKPCAACVAIAGPINDGRVKMTNLSWEFTEQAIAEEFGLDKFIAINDFGALAVATSQLNVSHLTEVKKGVANPTGNKAIIGPGTGLGVAGLAYAGNRWLPIPSEGGHVNLAPATALECDVLKAGIARFGHVSAEVFISGPGLVNLYCALCDVRGEAPKPYQPKDVTTAALDGSDAVCHQALNLFCGFLGTVSGNLALTYGASGGVYLAGGILPRFVNFLKASPFIERFSDKGVMSHYVKDIPAGIISYEYPAFLGAAAWLAQQ